MCPGISLEKYVHRIGDDTINLNPLAEESNVCGSVVAAPIRAS